MWITTDEWNKRTIVDETGLCTKKIIKNSKYKLNGYESDFIAFTVNQTKNICYVIKLKDGDNFDTKKSLAEKKHVRTVC